LNDNTGVAIFWMVIIAVFIFWSDVWDSKLRYQLVYQVSSNKVTKEKKPSDCDFMTAPLGRKNCHYNKVVVKRMWGKSSTTGSPVESWDDGKSWQTFTPNPGDKVPQAAEPESIMISWTKEAD